jgi:hypothetical protein
MDVIGYPSCWKPSQRGSLKRDEQLGILVLADIVERRWEGNSVRRDV